MFPNPFIFPYKHARSTAPNAIVKRSVLNSPTKPQFKSASFFSPIYIITHNSTMLMIEKRASKMPMLTPARFYSSQYASPTLLLPASAMYTPTTPTTTASCTPTTRKRKIIVDHASEKRARRTWSDLEYEEMLEEATLLREELDLMVMVAADLCQDLACDASAVKQFATLLQTHEELVASTQDVTVQQIREMVQQMATMMQYLCRFHYAHFALIDMQDQLKECRNRFMRFICQYAVMIGLQK